MRWFGRKAAQVAARPFLLRGLQMGGEPWPRSYEAQVRAAYAGNPVAQRAVRLVAEGCAGAAVYESSSASTEVVRGSGPPPPPPSAAVPLPVPGRIVTPALLEGIATHLLLHGNAFVQVICGASGEPVELFALRPERVKIEADASGWPAAYVYKAGQAVTRIAARDALGRPGLVHVRAMHPLDDHYGLGCLGAAAGAVAIHNEATRWNKALLDNAARPSGALLFDPGDGSVLAPAQFEMLRARLEEAFQGASNAGRPLVLEGGLKWQAMSLTPADMDFAAMKAAAAREIALAFGVPPMLLGLPGDATYANYKEANRALWRLTILPMLEKILGALSGALSAWWPGVKLEVDLDQVTALAEDRERLWRQVSGADFLSAEEKREMLGFGNIPSPGRGGGSPKG